MRITMVGTGYVGLVTGTCFANTGNDVTCLDVDAAKIAKLNAGVSPIYEPGLDEMIRRNTKAGRLHFTTDKPAAYQRAEIIFICVGTPSDESGHADLKYVLAAARDIGDAIDAAPGPEAGGDRRAKIVVVKSTVPVGTNAKVKAAIASRTKKAVRMASNPEFLKEGAAINDFNKPDRVVIGCEDKGTGDRLRDLYEPFVRQGNPIFVMPIASAEMVKYASNAMLATKISFINEIANLCEAYGADIEEVRRGMCSDRRIGNQFLYPGLGYGGSCFPKDVLACISMGSAIGTPTALLAAVHQVNQRQRAAFLAKIDTHFGIEGYAGQGPGAEGQGEEKRREKGEGRREKDHPQVAGADSSSVSPRPSPFSPLPSSPGPRPLALGPSSLAGKRFAIWGIAFKPGTDDCREAPSITLIAALLERGASVVAYDPVALEVCRGVFGDRIEYAAEPMPALDGAHALVLCTDWDEFKHPDFDDLKARMAEPVIFDGRNIYRPETMAEYGFVYYSVGRHPVTAPVAKAEAVRR